MRKFLATIALGATVISAQALAQHEQDGDGGGERAQRDMTRQEAQHRADSMFRRFDLNHDGVVTRKEAEQAAAQFGSGDRAERMIDRLFGDSQSLTMQQAEAQALARFDREDLNHDGVVTAAERQQERTALKAERGETPGQ